MESQCFAHTSARGTALESEFDDACNGVAMRNVYVGWIKKKKPLRNSVPKTQNAGPKKA